MNMEESEAGQDEAPEEGDGRVRRSDVEVEGLRFLLRQYTPPRLGNLIKHLVILHIRIGEDKMITLKNKNSLENNSFPTRSRTYPEAIFAAVVGAA